MNRYLRHGLLAALTVGLYARAAVPAHADPLTTNANAAWVAERYTRDLAAQADDPERFVRPGLVADRRSREVRLWADATGIKDNDPLEFLLVAEGSENGYEALAVSHAAPSAVDAALRFVGLTPGRAADPSRFAFWPKGERVMITAAVHGTNGWSAPVPVESLLWDDRTRAPFLQSGFVYVDGGRAPAPGDASPEVFIPDLAASRAIISLYNNRQTVFDVPALAPQGSVYGQQRANPHARLPEGTLLELVCAAGPALDTPRVRTLALTVHAPAPTTPRPADAQFELATPDAPTPGPVLSRDALTAEIARMVAEGLDVFVNISFAPGLRTDEARAAAQALGQLEGAQGLRIESPPPGMLYYRAYAPDEQYRRREDRVAQPFELHLTRGPDRLDARLVHIEERWHEDRHEPELIPTEYILDGPSALPARLQAHESIPVLLVFATPDLLLGELMPYVTHALPTHRLVHIFLTPAEAVTSGQTSDPVP